MTYNIFLFFSFFKCTVIHFGLYCKYNVVEKNNWTFGEISMKKKEESYTLNITYNSEELQQLN